MNVGVGVSGMCQGLLFEIKDNNFSKVPTITQQVFVNALKEMRIQCLQ